MGLDPKRTVAELEELRELTGRRERGPSAWRGPIPGRQGARVASREGGPRPARVEEIDEAGNQWFTLEGGSDKALLIGGAHRFGCRTAAWLDRLPQCPGRRRGCFGESRPTVRRRSRCASSTGPTRRGAALRPGRSSGRRRQPARWPIRKSCASVMTAAGIAPAGTRYTRHGVDPRPGALRRRKEAARERRRVSRAATSSKDPCSSRWICR